MLHTGEGLYIGVDTYDSTSELVGFINANSVAYQATPGPVAYQATQPIPVSVIVSADGQIALYALTRAGGHCAYLEDNEHAADDPTADGLAGATPETGVFDSVSPNRLSTCSAAAPAAGLTWAIFTA